MFFNKPVNKLTFQDIIRFLKQGIAENTMLDYKYMLPGNNEKFAKTIAAFANSMGGTVIIGVKDENDKPKPPFNGIPFHTRIRGQIESIVQNYIDPVVFVDVTTCKDPKSNNMFIVVNIPQSNLTPHLVGKLKRAYVRTGQASRPEVLVHPDQLPWLMDNRRKSQNLRHILLDKAEAHFNNFLRLQNREPSLQHALFALTLLPLYPQQHILAYKNLPNTLKQISFYYEDTPYPPSGEISAVQDGIAVTYPQDLSTWEFNAYGLVSHRTVLADGNNFIDKENFFKRCVLFFKTAARFYDATGFISPLLLRIKIANARGSKIRTAQGERQIIEDYVRADKNAEPSQLFTDLTEFTSALLEEIAWSLNIPFEQNCSGIAKTEEILNKCNPR